MRKTVRAVWMIALLALVAIAALLFTPLGARPLSALFAVGKVAPVDFARLRLAGTPNQYLVCPPGLCAAAPHAESPLFELPADDLAERWRAMAAGRPRVELVAEAADGRQLDYVQRSARFRFPDLVTVRFVALTPERSALAVYSRSLYGRRDFGVNRARVEAWLAALDSGG